MLCELGEPHGSLFSWLESQLHEHGPQPWGALREGLRDHPAEPLALKLMSGEAWQVDDNNNESEQELRGLLDRMLIERLKEQETEAIEASRTEPAALQRYRALQSRRRALEASMANTLA
jgi:DNA primase